MIATWLEFTEAVKAFYWPSSTPTAAQQYRAVADLAHALFVRQIESDLPLAKSFKDSYDLLKFKLAGSRIAANLAATQAAVKLLLPVDTDTDTNPSGTLVLDNAIEAAYDDFNGTADLFDVLLVQAAMDLQRHIPFYQGRNETTYAPGGSGLSNQGFVTQVNLPSDFRIQQVWAAKFHTELVEDVAFAVDDIVTSNGRFYKVSVGGTLTAGQLGDGLTEQTAGVEETLGDLSFFYHCDLKSIPVRKFPWADREAMFSGRLGAGPVYTTSPQFDKLWLYPALTAETNQFFMLEWVGVKTTYADDDAVTFDTLAAQAAAQYVKAFLAKDIADDGRAAAAALAMYQKLVRDAVIDNQFRETGTTNTTSELLAMNLGRVPWWRWSLMNATSSCGRLSNGNSEDDTGNASGTTNIVPTSANHVERISFTGDPGDRFVVLKPNGPYANTALVNGSRVLVIGTFEADVVGINVSFRDSTVGGTEMTSFSSDGSNLTIAMEFSWRSAAGAWELLRQQVPA